jgi:hypothetical protein
MHGMTLSVAPFNSREIIQIGIGDATDALEVYSNGMQL